MREFPAAIPDVDVLVALEPEELGKRILFLLRARPANEEKLHPSHWRSELAPHPYSGAPSYPETRRTEVATAIIEAMAWLEAQGLLVPARDSAGDDGWRMLSRRARRFTDEIEFEAYSAAQVLPKGLLHARIRDLAWLAFVRGSYATAVFEAMREVEIAVRDAAGFPESDHGVPMVRRAFHSKDGPLTDADTQEAEKEAISALSRARSARTRTRTRTGMSRSTIRARRPRSSCSRATCFTSSMPARRRAQYRRAIHRATDASYI